MAALRDAMTPESPRSLSDRLFGRHPIPAIARSWYIGLLGEIAVAERLRSLPDDWLVLHSVPVGNRGSDIDHVLVSPRGQLLTVNTKHRVDSTGRRNTSILEVFEDGDGGLEQEDERCLDGCASAVAC